MNTIQDEAAQLARVIIQKYGPEKVVLFGSAARGDSRQDSDIDLLIIKATGKKKAYRIKEVFETIRGLPRTYALDPLVYTPDELAKRLALGDSFITTILSEGKVLHG